MSNEIIIDVLGYLIAASIPLIAGVGVYEYRRIRREDRLRKALITDLKQMEIDPTVAYLSEDLYLHDSIFRGNVSNIGMLSNQEISNVIRFYSRLRRARYEIYALDVDDESEISEEVLANARKAREDACDSLNENIKFR